MRILMVTDFYAPLLGGVEQHVRTLSHELCRRGHEVAVATLHTADTPARERDGPVEVIRIRSTAQRFPRLFDQARPWAPPIPDPGAARALRRIVGEFRPDVVHGHDWLARSVLPALRAGPPLVTSLHYFTRTCAKKTLLHDDRPCAGPSPLRCLRCASRHYGVLKGPVTVAATVVGRHLERGATDRFIAVSTATVHGNDGDDADPPFAVVPNFVDEFDGADTGSGTGDADDRDDTDGTDGTDHSTWSDLDPLLDQLPEAEFFAYVGDFRSAKGFDVLLEAYAGLDSDRPLVAIGKRWPTSPSDVPAGVICLDRWPNRAVRAALGRARALIVPSVWTEPFGIVAIEAMAAGTPVIASATGGLVDIVDHRRTGLVVEPGSVDDLRAAMAELDHDRSFCAALGRQAIHAAEQYRASEVVPRIEAIYEAVVRARAVSP